MKDSTMMTRSGPNKVASVHVDAKFDFNSRKWLWKSGDEIAEREWVNWNTTVLKPNYPLMNDHCMLLEFS